MAMTEVTTCLTLQDPVYTSKARRGFGGHTFAPTVKSALSTSTALRLLKHFTPTATRAWHAKMADLHAQKSLEHSTSWSEVADRAAMRTFGRRFEFHDYRISAIGQDEFAEEDNSGVADRFFEC